MKVMLLNLIIRQNKLIFETDHTITPAKNMEQDLSYFDHKN